MAQSQLEIDRKMRMKDRPMGPMHRVPRGGMNKSLHVSATNRRIMGGRSVLLLLALSVQSLGFAPRFLHGPRFPRLWVATSSSEVASGPKYDIQFGDTSGAALLISDAYLSRGPMDLLNEVNWRVNPRERWGIVGPNG